MSGGSFAELTKSDRGLSLHKVKKKIKIKKSAIVKDNLKPISKIFRLKGGINAILHPTHVHFVNTAKRSFFFRSLRKFGD
jgi:hypothetical protein